jgi:hypothetical protein
MPFIAADWSIDASKNIRYIGDAHGGASPSYALVIELHRGLQTLAYDASATGDDLVDITSDTPSDRSTDEIVALINGYNIDDLAAEHLYGGSIIQSNGDTIYDGVVNFGNATFFYLLQNGARITDDFWNSFAPAGFNPDANQGISHRFLVKVRDAGADIDGRRLLGLSREYQQSFTEFPINGTSRGNNVLALSESADLNNTTTEATIATYTDIVNGNEGYVGLDVNADSADEFYYSNWDIGSRNINDLFERIKYLTRRGTAVTLYGIPGDVFRGITHEIDIDNPTGTFQEPEPLSWTGGTGQLLAIDSTIAGTKVWIQLLTGAAPTDGLTMTGGISAATADVNVTVTSRNPTIGGNGPLRSTGSAIIGAFGFGIEPADLSASDQVTSLANVVVTPPNNVTFSVDGLISGEDRVLVTSESGGGINVGQDTVNGALSVGATDIVVNTAIPSDTPATGSVRVFNGTTLEQIFYSSYAGSTYTVDAVQHPTGIPNAIADGANLFISYIDKVATNTSESFTSVFLSPRPLFIRVRDGGGS